MFLNRLSSFILSGLSGLLLLAAWPVSPLTPFIFVAWIPFFYLAGKEKKQNRFLLLSFLAMLVWNTGTTWWIWNSTGPGAVSAIVANSFLMCLPLLGFFIFKKNYGDRAGWVALMGFWLSFEYIHLNWQLSWPWLTLGNVFATRTGWVQWYEYTGVSGGSLWVLLVNVFIYKIISSSQQKTRLKAIAVTATLLIVPLTFSWYIRPTPAPAATDANVIIVQPNIDPYTEKFDQASTAGQVQKLVALSEQDIDTNTRLVIWPETALPVAVLQDQVMQNPYYKLVFDFASRHPAITIETGIETIKNYGDIKATNTARKDAGSGTYYDVFNAAVAIKANQPLQFYNKSKLVPGVETLPDFLIWMSAVFEKFGGTAGGYGHDKEAAVFKENNTPYVTAPIICYESIYGEYITSYIHKNANLLTIITNDGWWANTAGHKQHLQYARLRAVETRKWVARSANTGISAVIDNAGDIVALRKWDEAAYIKYAIPVIAGETFYVRNGPIIFRLAIFMLIVLLSYHFVMLLKRKFISKK